MNSNSVNGFGSSNASAGAGAGGDLTSSNSSSSDNLGSTHPMEGPGPAAGHNNGANGPMANGHGHAGNPNRSPSHGHAGQANHNQANTILAGSNAVNIADYFNQLVRDKKNLQFLPNYFLHAERLLDDEINKVKNLLCSATDRKPLDLPDAKGPTVTLTEKIFVPVDKYPNFNFVGRILGPQGTTAKDIEMYTGCKIMVRGEGSMRDKKKEDQLKGKPNFEHLNEKLHVLIQCEDTHNRCQVRMEAVVKEIKKLLDPKPDGEDEIKRRQLMGLAVLNGTYRETSNLKHQQHQTPQQSPNAQQLMMPDLTGLFPGLNPTAAAGLGGFNLDQATLLNQLNQLNQANLATASLMGNPLRATASAGAGNAANQLGRFTVPTLLPNATGMPNVSAASQNAAAAAFLQAGAALPSPTAEGLLYAAGYDPAAMFQNSAFAPLFSTNSPSASELGQNSESGFGKSSYNVAY